MTQVHILIGCRISEFLLANLIRLIGNILATKKRIAHIRWRIQIVKTLSTISPIQNCLIQALKERMGMTAKCPVTSPLVLKLPNLMEPERE